MSNIIPTVGRRVWFYENGLQEDPFDAGIIKVLAVGFADPLPASSTTPVNLDVCDPDTGVHHIERNVNVGDDTTEGRHYRWMPYQQGQTAKSAT